MLAQAITEASTLSQILDFANKFGGGVVVPIVLGVLAYMQLKAKYQVEKVKLAAEEVKNTLEKTTASTDRKLDATHSEVLEVKEQTNGHLSALTNKIDALEIALRESRAATAREKAQHVITGPMPGDPNSPEKP